MRLRGEESAQQFLAEWDDHDDAITARTSGSTGTPKTIRLLKTDMLSSATATNRFFGISSSSHLLCPLSPQYIAGKMMIVRAIAADCSVDFVEPSNHFMPLSPADTYDLTSIVPSQAEWLISPYNTLDYRLRNVIIGGAPLSPEMESHLIGAPFDAWASYGMTETASHVALRHVGDPTYQAMPGITFDTTPDRRLIIVAPHFSWKSLTTTDIVDLVDPIHFRWRGRADNVVNSGGIKLHPEEIEREISRFVTAPFYLTSTPDKRLGHALVMVIEGHQANTDALLATLRSSLPKYHSPRQIITVDHIERTSSGKIIRRSYFR